jgi:hypothetical protein
MRKNVILSLFLIFFLAGCASNKESITISEPPPPDPTSILLKDQLPAGAHGVVSLDEFKAIIADEPYRYPTTLITKIVKDQLIVMASLDISKANTDSICHGDVVSLEIAARYIAYLNHWFYAKRSEWDENLSAALAQYRYLYVVEFRRDDMTLQIHGKIIQGAYGTYHMELQSPVYLNIPGWEEVRLAPIERDAAGTNYIQLGAPYNPITGDYYTSYLVYTFFDRQDVLQNIPKPKPW